MSEDYVIAVDSGGTFSDCVIIDRSGTLTTGKAPSTPEDFSLGVLNAIESAAEALGRSSREILGNALLFAHGTTVATNALLERKGSPTGLITTAGHEDAILIGRTFQKVAGLTEDEITQVARLRKPDPIVPRRMIRGIHERMDSQGNVVVPLNRDSLAEAARLLIARGAESIGVSLLWSFMNPAHEQEVGEYLRSHCPDIPVTLSSDLAPVIREYERGITVAINSYLVGRTGRYLQRLSERIAEAGYRRVPVVMQSSGGVAAIELVRDRAVNLITSGPAGGVMAAKSFAARLGHDNVISTDVGGTSFDVGLIVNGEPVYAEKPILAGFHLVAPMIDVATIGAGGGSIAWVEKATGLLHVGPESAGANPGPVCYARGGTRPTVTDADVALGRINPRYFLGGRNDLDAQAAEEAIKEHVAGPLGLDVMDAALSIVRIAEAHMTDLVRRVSIERGYDPRRFHIYAFGGAGPAHAAAYGSGLGARGVVVPAAASEFSALGIATSDLLAVGEISEVHNAPLDMTRIREIYDELESRTRRELIANGVETGRVEYERFMRLRYRGQVNELLTPIPPLEETDAPIIDAFDRLYATRFGPGAGYKQAGIQALTYMVHARGSITPARIEPEDEAGPKPAAEAVAGSRPVVFRDAGRVDTQVYRSVGLRNGNRFQGPAIVEAPTTTIVVPPGHGVSVDAYRNILITQCTQGNGR